MYGSPSSAAIVAAANRAAAAAAPGASGTGPPANGPDRDKLESRFLWMLSNAEVADDLLDKFGTFGLTSLVKFRYIAKDEDKLRAFFKKKPFELDDDIDAKAALELAKLIGV